MTTVLNIVVGSSVEAWREWLAANAHAESEAWLVIQHKNNGVPSIRIEEAMEQALCFGWIDGLHKKHDAGSSRLRFTPRRPKSTWSAVNRERAERLIEQGLMTEAGQAMIDLAKETGIWEAVPDGVPADLEELLAADPVASANFDAFPPSSKRLILEWVGGAKKPETRQRRIVETVELARENVRANHR